MDPRGRFLVCCSLLGGEPRITVRCIGGALADFSQSYKCIAGLSTVYWYFSLEIGGDEKLLAATITSPHHPRRAISTRREPDRMEAGVRTCS